MTEQPATTPEPFSAAFWDQRYAGSDRVWSGRPNPRLVEHASGLAAGRALDVGCGEGADAIWLAQRGWSVTGVDISSVAVDRAAREAAAAGVADRTTFLVLDLLAEEELPGGFDLVSAQFLHLPAHVFDQAYARVAAAVAPGGALLVVGHHPDDLDSGLRHAEYPDLMFTAERVAALLDRTPGAFDVRVADAVTRDGLDREGRPVTVTDAVVLAVRDRPAPPGSA